MSPELGLPPPAKRPPSAPTAITDIGDDLLHEIFLLLPSLPSLVRAALACSTFLHAVRSSPAFRRRFQALHPPQVLGFFIEPCHDALPTFAPFRSRSDQDLAAAVRGSDFFLTRLPENSSDSHSRWDLASCHSGYAVFINLTTEQIAAYNPLTQALDIFPLPPEEAAVSPFFDFHIVISVEDQRAFRMVFVQRRNTSQLCVAVFSSATREWQVLPWVETPTPPQPEVDGAPPTLPQPEDDADGVPSFYSGMQVNGFVYWKHMTQAYVLVLNTVTLQFSIVDLPVVLGVIDYKLFRLGQSKDGELCLVSADDYDANIGSLVVWFWRADDDGVEKWMLEETFPLGTFIDVTNGNATVQIEEVIDGYVYLSAKYVGPQSESLVSLCLETGNLKKLFDDTYTSPANPYIMAWPPSLVCNREESQANVVGVSVADVGPVGTKESPSVLDGKNSIASKVTAEDI
ncbi:hypothetical protein ACQ4PT_054250 [Festuca glaucescens]